MACRQADADQPGEEAREEVVRRGAGVDAWVVGIVRLGSDVRDRQQGRQPERDADGRRETTAVDSAIGILADIVSVTGSTLLTDSFLFLIAFNGAAAINNSRLQTTQGEMLVFAETDNTVAGSALIAGGAIGAAANTGAAAVRNSVRSSRFVSVDVQIVSTLGTTSVTRSDFTGVTGTITISGAAGCTTSGNVPTVTCS